MHWIFEFEEIIDWWRMRSWARSDSSDKLMDSISNVKGETKNVVYIIIVIR